MDFLLRTKLNNIYRTISFCAKELEIIGGSNEKLIDSIIEKGLIAHKVKFEEILAVDLMDEYRLRIDDQNASIVYQFKNCSHFYVELCIQYRHNDVDILAESITNFLNANECGFIFKEQEILHKIKPKTMKKLTDKLVDYLFENYTMYPSMDDIILISNATVQIFNGLKDNQGGIRNLVHVDPVTKSKSGCLYNAVVYRRRRNRRTERSVLNVSLAELNDEQKTEVNNYLRTCCLPGDKDALKVILSQYKNYRKELIRKSFDDYKSIWNFYFVCPDLVLFDFTIMFNDVNASSLIDAWPKIKNYPFNSKEIRVDDKKYPISAKNSDIYAFFSYIKLISTYRVNFDKAMRSFVLYSDNSTDDPEHMKQKKYEYPYIIVITSQASSDMKFYIDVEGRLFSLPTDFTFVNVMDFLFKAHRVFNLAYNPKLKAFMYFFEYYIFGQTDAKRFVPQKYETMGQEIIDILSTFNRVQEGASVQSNAI